MTVTVKGQFLDSLDKHFRVKPKFILRLDSRSSFVTAHPARIFGVKIGWEYNEKVRIGIGYNFLRSGITKDKIIETPSGQLKTVKADLNFSYFTPFFDYIFFETKRWEHSVPIQVGFGNSHYSYVGPLGNELRENFSPVILYEPAMATHFKFFPWLGVGAGVGYRLLLFNNKATGENFNSPVYVIKLKLFVGELYRGIFKKPKKDETSSISKFTTGE